MKREHVHLIGIGGTGMTALAGLLQASGCRVTGSDGPLYPPTSTLLAELALTVYEGFDATHLEPTPDLVVIGNALSRGNVEIETTLDRDLEYASMPQVLHERFLRHRHSVVVAGTHGKTTTVAMLAWVLTQAGRNPGFLVGGAPQDFPAPFGLGGGELFVIEGDEYDTAFFDKGPKFMHYRPDTVILNSVEYDHADIYPDFCSVKTAFRRLTQLVPRRGLLVYHEDCEAVREVTAQAPCKVRGFGIERGEWRAVELDSTPDAIRFRIERGGDPYVSVALAVPGEHNVRNALAVAAAADSFGLSPAEIARGLAGFRGVRRRLELRGTQAGVTVIDDFAHHPTAIEATLRAVRSRWPEAKIWAVAEPRSSTMRRRVFQDRLVAAFDAADQTIIASVWGADALPAAERLDPERLVSALVERGRAARFVSDVGAIATRISEEADPGDVVVIMSNGAFGGLHERLLELLEARSVATLPRYGP